MAKLKDGNYYSQKVVFDYQNRKLLLNVEKTELAFDELFLETPPQKVLRFKDIWQRIFIVFAVIVLLFLIYTDIILFNENPVSNSLLIGMWLAVLGGLGYYYFKTTYSVTLKHGEKVLIIHLNQAEKIEFEAQFKA